LPPLRARPTHHSDCAPPAIALASSGEAFYHNMWQPSAEGRRALLADKDSPDIPTEPGMLQDYSADFIRLKAVAANKVRTLRDSVASKSWADDVRAAERALEAMESNRRQVQVQLRLELSGASGATQDEWNQRLQEWAREVASFRAELESVREEHGRRTLRLDDRDPAVARASFDSASLEGRSSALQSTEMMERGMLQLQQARQQALEAEEVADGVMTDLSTQRDVVNKMKANMRTIGAELSSARQSIGRMLQRAQQNRLVTLAITTAFSLLLVFWALCFFGMPLTYTMWCAVAVLIVGTIGFAVQRKMKTGAGT